MPKSLGSKLFLTLFLSVFIAVGCLATGMIIKDFDRRLDQRDWDQVPCVITLSTVAIDPSSEKPYSPTVTYRYEIDGRPYTGNVAVEGGLQSGTYTDAQAVTLRYPAGETRTALVNPDDPAEAILERTAVAASLLFLLFPLMFCVGPLIFVVAIWWPKGGKAGTKSISSKKTSSNQLGPRGLLIFGMIVMVVAIGVGMPLAVFPTMRTIDAEGWDTVPAEVKRSAVVRISGDDGDTFRTDILYEYEIAGQTYASNRYSFTSLGSSSGSQSKRELVAQYPVGKQIQCYVNPDDPTRAVLVRGWRVWNLLALIPLLVFIGGAAMCWAGVNKMRLSRKDPLASHVSTRSRANYKVNRGVGERSDRSATAASRTAIDQGPVVLSPGMSRMSKAAGLLILSLFWNGIVSIFVWQVVKGFRTGSPDMCMTVCMIPFVVIGIGIMVGFVQSLLVIAAPVVELELDRRAMPLGGSTRLRWRVAGRPGKLHGLTITLIGTESATYTRGTDTVTDNHTFYEEHLFGGEHAEAKGIDPLSLPIDADRGELTLRIPAETMHSFEGGNNRVEWKLKVRAWVPRWPDPKDEYDLKILPMEVGG